MSYKDRIHLFISDFDLRGSGYMNIATACCIEMSLAHKQVIALGLGYKGQPHSYPFTLLPVEQGAWFQHVKAMLNNIQGLSQTGQLPPIGSLTVALDIPLQLGTLDIPRMAEIPYIAIFPLESGPIRSSWAEGLQRADARLVMSKYGVKCLEDRGVKSEYIHLGLHEAWRKPEEGERDMIRETMGYREDDFVVCTVADNQERKNLSAAMEMIARARTKLPNVKWVLVTRKQNKVGIGWDIDDLAWDYGVGDIVTSFERGISFKELWKVVVMSDLFLLTSKAEGLCMPILEAMATKTPVLASDCTAIPEHIFVDPANRKKGLFGDPNQGERGFVIPIEYVHRDVWGNSDRHFVDIQAGADQIVKIAKMSGTQELENIVNNAYDYVKGRTWDKVGARLNAIIDSLQPKRAPVPSAIPDTIPQNIPFIVPQIKNLPGE